jgi:hypothetical protein
MSSGKTATVISKGAEDIRDYIIPQLSAVMLSKAKHLSFCSKRRCGNYQRFFAGLGMTVKLEGRHGAFRKC